MGKEVAVKAADNLPATLQEELEALQKRVAAPTGSRITVMNSGKFKVPGVGEVDGPIDVIIVDFASNNSYYKGAFNKNNPAPPVCAAVGTGPNDELTPHEDAPDLQSDNCKTCPMNQFGSNGLGKACKNTKTVALLPADAVEGDDTAIMTLSISPTGIKGFDATISQIAAKYARLPRQMVVSMFSKQAGNSDAKTVGFGEPRPIDDAQFGYVQSRLEEARAILLAAPRFE
jgi:hypothetical protein